MKAHNKKFNTESYSSFLSEHYPHFIALSEFVSVSKPLDHQCLNCGEVWTTQPRQILANKQCRKCYAKSKAKPINKVLIDLAVVNPDFALIGKYRNAYTKTTFRHSCGFVFETRPDRILRERINCRNCTPPKHKETWAKPVETSSGVYQSKLEAECGEWLYAKFSPEDIDRYKLYDNTSQRNCDFYIKSLDLWLEVSSINKEWYLERIFTKRKLVNNFLFVSSLEQLKILLS